MSFNSSNGEAFGSAVLYGAMVVMSLILLLCSISPLPPVPAGTALQAPGRGTETVVVVARPGKVS